MSKSQCEAIREALEAGQVLTWLDIYKLCGCKNHGARISELRQQGMDIPENQLVTINTEYGKKEIGIYFLKSLYTYQEAKQIRFPSIYTNETSSSVNKPVNNLNKHIVEQGRDGKGRYRPVWNKPTEAEIDRAVKLYVQGKTLADIYLMFPYIANSSLYIALKARIRMRNRGQQKMFQGGNDEVI